MEERYPELDALRGLAVILMVIYHAAFDLEMFYRWDIPVVTGIWRDFAYAIASTFLVVMGVCFAISWQRSSTGIFLQDYKKYLRRGVGIFLLGMLVSGATYLMTPTAFVKFGILHLIGVSALLQPFFAQWKTLSMLLMILLAMVLGVAFHDMHVTSRLLFPLGLTAPGFASLDYYPLFPWFGMVLIGMIIGKHFYTPAPHRMLHAVQKAHFPNGILYIGRKALLIYFLHQPMLMALFLLLLGPPVIH